MTERRVRPISFSAFTFVMTCLAGATLGQVATTQPATQPAGNFVHAVATTRPAAVAPAAAHATPAAAPSPAPAPGTIADVQVEGNDRMSTSAVLSSVQTRPGQPYDAQLLRQDQQRLLRTGRYRDVQVVRTDTSEGIVVTFRVVEQPLISRLEFVGNTAIKEADLRKELSFGAGDPLSNFNIESGRQAIVNAYRKKGYYFVEVDLDRTALESQQQVIYRITQGPKVAISKIKFQGNEFFSSLRLRFEIGSSAKLWPFIPGLVEPDQIEQDINTIRKLYIDQGFLDAEVARELEFSQDKTRVTLTFVIDEGPRYRVNCVFTRGNSVFQQDQLQTRLLLDQGKFFTQEAITHDTKALQDAYGEIGFIDANVQMRRQFLAPDAPRPDWAAGIEDELALVNVIFNITEGQQYRMGRVDIRGNEITQSRIIRRELRFYPGQLFNTVAVEESKRRLSETRFFDEVNITRVGQEPGVRDVVVNVKEGQTGQFLVGAGINSNEGLVGRVSVTQRNFDLLRWPRSGRDLWTNGFRGAGQTLSVVAEPGVEVMRFHVDWTEPSLYDGPYSLGSRLFYFTAERDEYDEERVGGLMSLGRRFDNGWYTELAPRLEQVDISEIDSTAPEILETEGNNLLAGLKGTVVRDRTDSRWSPSTGDRLRLSYEQVGGDWQFSQATGEYRIFRTLLTDALDRKHVVSQKVAAGQIFGEAPVFERFFGGGLGSIRGFDYRGISPRSAGTNDAIGGDFMFLTSSEYEFPLVGQNLRGVFFIDSGTVEEDFGISSYRVSTGVGIRWVVPMFGPMPIPLDLGIPLLKDEDDDTELLSFSMGATF